MINTRNILSGSRNRRRTSILREVMAEIKAAQKMRLPGWAVLCLAASTLALLTLFDHLGKKDLVIPIMNSILVLALIFGLKQALWGRVWFWITMTTIAALHVPLILFVPWTSKWVPALVIAIIDSADFCLIVWILAVVREFVGNVPEAS